MYINDLAMVMFTGIKHTADWFLASFKENEVASCFIDWAKQQIENYAEMFRKQVYISDVESKTVDEALQITYSQSKKLLQEYGLDFRFLLDELLVENPKDKTPPPFIFSAEPIIRQPDAMPTPRMATPTLSVKSPPPAIRSPAPATPSSSSIRSRLPQQPPASTPPPPPLASPQPRRARSPPSEASPRLGRATPQTSTNDQARTPKSARSSPVPPGPPGPRAMNRPGSSAGQRPPPVAVPRREGMI